MNDLAKSILENKEKADKLKNSILEIKAQIKVDRKDLEELIAEMAAAYLCAEVGISTNVIENQAAYINGWLSKLKNDKKLLISAASQAQKAADYILNKKFESTNKKEEEGE